MILGVAVVEYALRTCGPVAPNEARIARIKDTLHLNEVYVSRPVWEELDGRPGFRRIGEFTELLAGEDWCGF
ncbi:MAG: hypothetical protein ACUVRM_04080 [Bacillota bacterium]